MQAVVAAKPEVPPPAPHEDWNETVEPVASWAEEAPAPAPAAATTFGAPAAQEDWAAQVLLFITNFIHESIFNLPIWMAFPYSTSR